MIKIEPNQGQPLLGSPLPHKGLEMMDIEDGTEPEDGGHQV
jgi:hypothetical protein